MATLTAEIAQPDTPSAGQEDAGAEQKPGRLGPAAITAKLAELDTSPKGLSAAEAAARLEKNGPNAIVAHEEPLWRKLLGYFWGPIAWMIEAAAIISLLRRDWPDFIVVTTLLLYNAGVGFWQDAKAASALAALKKGLALKARVLRDGKWINVDAADLVVGDITDVVAGEIVPADLLLIGGSYLSIDQAALTGESLPVSKAVGDTAYSGSVAKQGDMQGVVTAIGNATFFGRTAKLVASAGAMSHSQKAVVQIGDFLILLAAALAVLLVGVQVYRTMVEPGAWSLSAAGDIAQFVLVLLVASVPVALPAVMSVTLALGALALSKQKAIVSRLSAIDELAGVDILCSDKTGTLTMNKLTLSDPIPFGGAKSDDIVFAAALATKRDSEDAIDLAVLGAVKHPEALDKFALQKLVPFDPVSKRTLTVVKDTQGELWSYAKGAPQAISALCHLDPATEGAYDGKVHELAMRGYRALGVASSKDDGQTWTLLGLLPLLDPPRPDAKQTIASAKRLGLSVKMVTGDDVAIGGEIAGQLGIGAHLLVAGDVFPKNTDPKNISIEAAHAVERADGFGRVFPEHKFEIVKSLQSLGHIVAMTGDGVNDAPALKQADCGVAVSGATDAARSAAALILTAPGLSTIVNAIIEARCIFERIQSYVYYRIAMTIAIMLVVVLSSVIFKIQPLTAIMIVVLALLDDIPIMTIAYDNVKAAPRPVRWNMHHILVFSGLMGLMATAQSFGLVLLGIEWMRDPIMMNWIHVDPAHLQTMLFLQLAAGGHMLLFVVRSRRMMLSKPYPSAPLFLAIVATQLIAVLMCGFGILVPKLPWSLIGVVWAYVIAWTVLTDLVKMVYDRVTRPPKNPTPLTANAMPLA
ncbi:H+-transporting ATPase [Rhodoblastus acidophilus]|uniref:plasma-membrane proton-efflux P-type ATPase n=1 Tax=Rhodoblastus acidophilus TaxID=1074 RepID=UPI002224A7B3|nr:plasma-membrane proton-efflux P-type ATPase [Rhodoblastus acidophilus]MCW2284522.1 H+-transporting ATPase [Rhodoblastus acidophilus]MCW2333475.1 H+-transporting ATPase [Rhodoblastus acidophilus]